MEAETRKIPTHEVTYSRLRDMILYGHLEPGAAVTIQGLVSELEAGMTPVREAIRRLSAEGALEAQGNRRVVVPKMTQAMLDQVAFARLTIEPKLAELAAAHLTPGLIDRLRSIDNRVDQTVQAGDIPGYLESNHAFHFCLYEASNAPVLVDMARSMWLRFGPALRVVCARYGRDALPDRHFDALAAMKAGDAAALKAAIESDISQGIEQVRMALEQGEI
ncbi:GntR family transcriptional regulator [Thioclava sp. FR2]|uniref:GntR family transcriptional regulator n=1 Tax=Thioclava sp. FR2 TaxID=3445780 RepID=UPI003EBD48AF